MKPLKSARGLARWILRLSLIIVIFFANYTIFLNFNIKSVGFYFSLIFLLSGLLLLVGGFLKDPSLTIISSLIILILSVYQLIKIFNGSIGEYLIDEFISVSLAFYFLSAGNKSS
ncbi:MAG: hypothetical protein JXJ22_10400 [Bacteroidales bacterium]|nr:hypothetical protein [Bacteroidales bacterium]